MAEELPTLPPPAVPIKQPQRLNPQDIRNSDLVSRFLAATPSYLYSPPVGPQNFFFSEMLRSLVQAKTNEQNARNLSQFSRRPRKRSWSRCMYDSQPVNNLKEPKETNEKITVEKPLELTNKLAPPSFSISSDSSKFRKENVMKISNVRSESDRIVSTNAVNSPETASAEPSTASLPPSDLVLPPPPPMWYPPLYPPYGIDPLHFFIDLRVSASGHIYDRKKENISPTGGANVDNNNTTPSAHSSPKLDTEAIGKPRLGSAFSVPPPRREKSPLALNLTSSTCPTHVEKSLIDYRNSLLFDRMDKESLKNSKNTNYVLQNLPRIYTTMTPQNNDDRQSLLSEGSESKSESDLQEVDIKDEEKDFASDDVVIVDCQDTDGSTSDNNNSKNCSF